MVKIEICGKNYDELSFIEKLGWIIVYPLIAILVLIMVGVVLIAVSFFIIPLLMVIWIYMLIKLFQRKE